MAIRFQTTEQDMVAAYRLHYAMSGKKAAWLFGAFLLGLVAYLAAQNTYGAALAGGAAGLVIAHLAILHLVVPNRARHLYRQQKNLHTEHQVSWDDQCVYIRSDGYNENLRWADLVKAKENDALVLLYRSDYNLSMIPKRSFASADAYAQFRRHLVPRCLR
ncbi:YcxB family protein [Ralstonia mojiangensis]|uniref:YcxB family protein n=1 Tax=Ralstonia mojiangensis TaxID=2953895 RepID=UPI0021B17077|nr:YcxB family protein [Ralstonia mojiangensis]MCT7327459.1 YcxB family protein [Ralstonia mojiangensis]